MNEFERALGPWLSDFSTAGALLLFRSLLPKVWPGWYFMFDKRGGCKNPPRAETPPTFISLASDLDWFNSYELLSALAPMPFLSSVSMELVVYILWIWFCILIMDFSVINLDFDYLLFNFLSSFLCFLRASSSFLSRSKSKSSIKSPLVLSAAAFFGEILMILLKFYDLWDNILEGLICEVLVWYCCGSSYL